MHHILQTHHMFCMLSLKLLTNYKNWSKKYKVFHCCGIEVWSVAMKWKYTSTSTSDCIYVQYLGKSTDLHSTTAGENRINSFSRCQWQCYVKQDSLAAPCNQRSAPLNPNLKLKEGWIIKSNLFFSIFIHDSLAETCDFPQWISKFLPDQLLMWGYRKSGQLEHICHNDAT